MKKNLYKKIIIIAFIIALIVAFKLLNLGEYFTLEFLKESRERLVALYQENPLLLIGAFSAIYILSTALSLPGATVLTIASGALFGLIIGTLVVSISSTIGATAACLASRFLLRDWVQSRFSDRLKKINDGIEREGKLYLFTLRLVPVFPFWLINLAMGLTGLPLRTFAWVSMLGMLPGTIIYVNAGREIASINSPKEIMSPGVIISFVLIGVFPLITKKVVNLIRKKRGIEHAGL